MLATLESLHGLILTTHIISTVVTMTIVVATDLYGFLWLIGKKETLSVWIVRRAHQLVWAGLLITMSMGALLFLPYASYLLTDTAFQIKLLLIGFLIGNALVIGKHIHIATKRPFATLGRREKAHLVLSGLVSTTGWVGAILAAQFIAL